MIQEDSIIFVNLNATRQGITSKKRRIK